MNAILPITMLFFAAPPSNDVALGEIKAGALLQHQFTISNAHATKTMVLLGLTASCGCSSHAFGKSSLKPGEATTVTVKINTLAHAAGAWTWTANVRTQLEGEQESVIPLRLSGTLVREVAVTPAALSISTDGAAIEKVISIKDNRTTPFIIVSLTTSSQYISVKSEVELAHTRKVIVTIAATLPYGEHAESITITTNDPLYPEFRIPVNVSKRMPKAVLATPEQVELSVDQPSMLVQFRRLDGKELTVATCECDDKNLVLTWSKIAGVAATMRVKLTADGDAKSGQTTVTLKLSEPAGETVTVPVKWSRN